MRAEKKNNIFGWIYIILGGAFLAGFVLFLMSLFFQNGIDISGAINFSYLTRALFLVSTIATLPLLLGISFLIIGSSLRSGKVGLWKAGVITFILFIVSMVMIGIISLTFRVISQNLWIIK